jgi:hypothetical protein
MDPRDFLTLAKKLSSAKSPAELRTAISRAYYSVFNFARDIINNLGYSINEGPNAHGDIKNQLSNSSDDELKQVGSNFGTLHTHRIRADYVLQDRNSENPNTARFLIALADSMIVVLDSHVKDKAKKQQFKKTLQDYKQKTRPS